ncbi:MAG: hypothetical protein JSW38_10870 [Dehalococcoidia bacterium]|nr:MAG: hypothetical protein JSW38_10870 [Dehalococcoidia bacterium]
MQRSDILMLIAVWEMITAMGALIGIIAIAVFAFPDTNDVGGYFGLSIATIVLLSYFCLAMGGGIGLLMRKQWGRTLSIIYGAISLLYIPFGTIIGALILFYLFRSKTKEYFEAAG